MEQLELPAELVAPFQIEARAEIVRLRAAGYGAAAVANSLNARNIPTPSGRGKWWPDTVKRHADPMVRLRWARYIAEYRHRTRVIR